VHHQVLGLVAALESFVGACKALNQQTELLSDETFAQELIALAGAIRRRRKLYEFGIYPGGISLSIDTNITK